MLFAGWEVRMVKNCDRGLENTARGRKILIWFTKQVSCLSLCFSKVILRPTLSWSFTKTREDLVKLSC